MKLDSFVISFHVLLTTLHVSSVSKDVRFNISKARLDGSFEESISGRGESNLKFFIGKSMIDFYADEFFFVRREIFFWLM